MTLSDRNIVLTGLMGTGKSTVARILADRLGRRLVDMDETIVQRARMPIRDIFRTQGEAAFRAMERALCDELSRPQGLVIATGGGALLDPDHRQALAQGGVLICLDAALEALRERMNDDGSRPLLMRLADLEHERRPIYAQIPCHIDTTGRTAAQVAAKAMALYEAAPWATNVHAPQGEYMLYQRPGALDDVGDLLHARAIARRVVVVSDERVWPLHGERLLDGLRTCRYEPAPIVLPAGEGFKTLETVSRLYNGFADAGIDRSGAVVALGGGVITDMAGFAAATFMRGVPMVPLPSTLLAMVDASVGGKVAVDHPRGKNLIGAFNQPLFVALDPALLGTLPMNEWQSGMAEVIKAAILGDVELFEALWDKSQDSAAWQDGQALAWLLQRALLVKVKVVEEDPFEQGRRAVLNLGHTFAHAFELLSNYQLSHGRAVSIGMAAAAHLAELRGLCTVETRTCIITLLDRTGLPTTYEDHDAASVYAAMAQDKKRRAGKLRLVLPSEIGNVEIVEDVLEGEIMQALGRIRR